MVHFLYYGMTSLSVEAGRNLGINAPVAKQDIEVPHYDSPTAWVRDLCGRFLEQHRTRLSWVVREEGLEHVIFSIPGILSGYSDNPDKDKGLIEINNALRLANTDDVIAMGVSYYQKRRSPDDDPSLVHRILMSSLRRDS